MSNKISKRLAEIVDALPLKEGIRILEIGCGPGVMARELSHRITNGYVLAIDRSQKAIEQAIVSSEQELKTGKIHFKQATVELFTLDNNEPAFDIAVAVRVGALDGRHPEIEKQALLSIAKTLTPNGRLFIDGGNPLKEIFLDEYQAQ